MITPKMKRRIRREFSAEKPTVWIGKEGMSLQAVNEIDRQLEKREVVKVRLLRSVLGNAKATVIALEIAKQTKSTLIEVRGHTFLLYRRRQSRKSEKSL